MNSEDYPRTAGRIRGSVAMRIIAELLTRLAGAQSWDFAAFRCADEVTLAGSSSQAAPDLAVLRAEVRLQRIAGAMLPHVGVPIASEARRVLYVIFGDFTDRLAILRLVRPAHEKPFTARDGGGIEQFCRQHADAMAASIFEANNEDAERLIASRAAPIAFTIDHQGAVIAASEPDAAPTSLRAQLMPQHGKVPAVLRPVIAELLERYHGGATGNDLVVVLPFALVRLTPLRSLVPGAASLVTVEWLRSRASLEATAAQFSISKRELQVLSSMLRGLPVAEIALELSISESTVVFHLKRMLKKTLSKNRTELAARMLGYEISA